MALVLAILVAIVLFPTIISIISLKNNGASTSSHIDKKEMKHIIKQALLEKDILDTIFDDKE